MITDNNNTKHTTLLERIADSEARNRLKLIHNEVVALFKVTSDDKPHESVRQKMMDSVKDLEINAMITYSSVIDSIDIPHHTNKVEGDKLEKKENYFSLLGHGNTGLLLVFKLTSILTTMIVLCPTWTSINAINDKDGIENARIGAMNYYFTSVLPIHPFLAASVLDLGSLSSVNVFLKFVKVVKKINLSRLIPTNTKSATTNLKIILPFLLATHHKKIQTITIQFTICSSMKTKFDEFHTLLHHKNLTSHPCDA